MSDTPTVGIIRPEALASKLAAIRNYEQPKLLEQVTRNPRLVEIVWFLQYISMQPGGLVKFAREMAEALPHRIGTPTMRTATGKCYSAAQKLAIRKEMASRYRPELPERPSAAAEILCNSTQEEIAAMKSKERKELERMLAAWDGALFRKLCAQATAEVLPGILYALCTEKEKGFDLAITTQQTVDEDLASSLDDGNDWFQGTRDGEAWFIDDPLAAVAEMVDRRAVELSKRIARTAVTEKVFDALDYAIQERAMVRVEGDSRFGKTESVKTWCAMRPGLARLVSVPSSNAVADLHRRIGEALGMETSYGSRAQRLRERVEFVLQHSGLFLVLDEGAFLVPQNYTAETSPARLNWVRTEIVDRGLPLAVIVTPQSFLPAVTRFVKKTGYAMEQFFGRNHRLVQLPAELGEKDMTAVARIHFPEMGDDYLAVIAGFASVSENYLQAVEAIAKLARYFARREGHRVTFDDIEAAASEVIPRRSAAPREAIQEPGSAPTPKRINASLKANSRAVKPPTIRGTKPADFDSSSLRSAASERASSELVSVEP